MQSYPCRPKPLSFFLSAPRRKEAIVSRGPADR
jgi:hypothetical protein